jgi:hypothetical protein
VVNISMTTPPIHETPRWNEGTRRWVSGYLQLRGQHDLRDLVSFDPRSSHALTGGPPFSQLVVNGSLPYAGGLVVVCVPKRSTWSLTLSDQPNVRTPPSAGSVGTWSTRLGGGAERLPPLPRERELVRR